MKEIECIYFKPSCFMPECYMEISVPVGLDAEEYINSYLEAILNEDMAYNCEWEFV